MKESAAPHLDGRMTYVPLPAQALDEVVASVDDLLELKVVLTLLRGLSRRRPPGKWITPRELARDPALGRALAALEPPARASSLAAALRRACERGLLVRARPMEAGSDEARYALNTEANRRALEAAGWSIEDRAAEWPPVEVGEPRSAIFELYEQNVGLVTPLLVEELREAEQTYPNEWIEDAFREAVAYNKRNWRYIRRILENWATEGRGERGASRRHAEAARNRRRNLGGRFGTVTGGD